jgi:DNA-binding CsgD family transcriptional regulator
MRGYFFIILLNIFFVPIVNSQSVHGIDSLLISLSEADSDSSRIQSLIAIADYYVGGDINMDKAVSYYNQALQIADENELHLFECNALLRLSRLYHATNYDIAQDYLIRAYNIAKENSFSGLYANIYTQFGLIKMYLEEDDKAREYFHKANQLYYERKDSVGIAANLHNLGILLNRADILDSAEQLFLQAAKINQRIGQYHFYARNLRGLTEICYKKGDLKKSDFYYGKSLRLSRDLKDYGFIQSLYDWKGRTFLLVNKIDSAIYYGNEILKLKEMGMISYSERDAFDILQQAYNRKGNYKAAFKYSQKLHRFNDSVAKFQHSREIDMLELKLKADNEIKLNELRYENRSLQMTIMLIALGFGFVLLSAFVYVLVRRIKKRQRENQKILKVKDDLELELKVKNRELTSKVMNLIEVNNTLDQILSRIDDPKDGFVKSNSSFFIPLVKEVKKHRNNNIWDAFEQEFIMVHPDFMKQLLKRHPDLTPKERRLCSLLRMNLSTKEISQILSLEVRSVEMARTRLRKKLNISGKDIALGTYFASIV